MKMRKFGLLLLIACVGFFVACKDTEEPQPLPEDDYAAAVEGTYGSILDIYVPAPLDSKTIEERDIKLTKKEAKSIKVELNNFQFNGLDVGNIVIDNVPLQKNGEVGYSLVSTTVKGMELGEGSIIADVTLTGVITGDELDFDIVITNVEGFAEAITVDAKGIKGGKYTDDNAKRVEGKYNSELRILVAGELAPVEKKEIVLTPTELNKIKFELKDFSFSGLPIGDLAIEDVEVKRVDQTFQIVEKKVDLPINLGGAELVAATTLKGTVEGDKLLLDLNIDASGLAVVVAIEGTNSANSSTLANILEIEFESPVIVKHPELGLNQTELTIEFGNATAEEMNNVTLKTLVISDDADSNIKGGSKVDFTKDGGKVQIIVTSQSGAAKTYTITASGVNVVGNIDRFDFDEWEVVNPTSLEKLRFKAPTPLDIWDSSNRGVQSLIQFNKTDKYNVTPVEGQNNEGNAAQLETLDTKGQNLLGQIIPKITSGSLYTGSFKLDWSETLNSTKFGIPYSKKPLKMEFYYKYKPGETFYRSTGGSKQAHKAEKEEGTIDKCAINAILYDITENDAYITGFDTYKDSRIVMRAEFESDETISTYKKISLPFVLQNEKTYDPSKKYRLAIIMSSSAEGDTFSGAPGSVLYVDDIEIISE